jgi:hypothetical protein
MPPARALDRRLAELERCLPVPPLPDPICDLLSYMTSGELIFIDQGACDDDALGELLNRAAARRDQGADMKALEEHERSCETWWPRPDGRQRRVIPHVLAERADRWLDVFTGEEGPLQEGPLP